MNYDIDSPKFLIDTVLLPLIEQAEKGCFDSQVELIDAFTHGRGTKVDDALAAKYEAMLFENTNDPIVKLAILWNAAIYRKQKGEYEAMKRQFQITIDFMQEHIPMEEWDFSLFAQMEEYTQLLEAE